IRMQPAQQPNWPTGNQQQYQPPPPAAYYQQPPPPAAYYAQQQAPPPPANPMAQFQPNAMKRSSITRAVSDELEYKGGSPEPQFAPQRKGVDVEKAMSEMLDYFDDRRAPLFAADALTTLLRTKPPIHVGRREVVETIVTWARNKSSVMGWP